MIKHSLILICRNFLRSRGYFLINLIGLATGLACTLLIYLWVREEVNMNKFHQLDARLYVVHFIMAGLIALITAWLTVATQAIKAANLNPVRCLRDQ